MIQLVRNSHVSHCDQKGHNHSIYSLDFQFGGSRLATGGGDATVRIWDLDSLLLQEHCEKLSLSVLSYHTKSVNTVRWSRDGTLLASGSDDCYILIYKLEGANKPTTQSVGSLAPHNQENWVRNLALHGHQMDVLDLDWSPTGLLASASIDNHILIWDIPSSLKSSSSVLVPLRQLNKHTSFVKGIQFDPFGIYLASSSSDNTVIIWNCDTWNAEHILEEPLRGSTDRSIFRRLSWAPDGGSLCITCALKEGKPVGMVLKRDIWDTSVADLVGHNAQTTCCRFNPHPLKISTSNSDANFTACTVALADQQGVLSLWTTTKKSPIFVVYNLFEGPVLDLAWFAQSDTSFLLGACSLDGSIVFLKLTGSSTTGGERCLSADEKDSHLKSIYGRGDKELSNSSTVLPEDPAVLRFKLDEQFEIANTRIAQKRKIVPISQPNFQQTITRLKNGKKRIQPIVTDSEVDLSSSLFATGASSSSLPTMTMYQPRARDHAPPPLHGNYLHPLLCTLSQRSQVPALLESVSASCIVKQNGVLADPCSPFGISSLKDRSALLQFYLTASELPPPRATDPIVSAISLARFGNSIPRQGQAEWETYVTGKVTTISGVKSIGANGIVMIGTSLGTLLILCLSSGMKLSSPLTLGGSIISADAVFLRDSKIFHIFALNSEGDLWLFSCHPQSLFSPTESGLKLVCKSSLHPLRSFLGLGGGEQGVATAIHLENTELTDSGELIVSVKSSNPHLSGGSFHFQLLNDLQCWRQISHLKSFLSMSLGEDQEEDIQLISEPKFKLSEIISHAVPTASSSSDRLFYNKLTLSEIEDNLVLSIDRSNLDNTRLWIRKWVFHCCKSGFESRIKLFVSLFLKDSSSVSVSGHDGSFGWIGNLRLGLPKEQILKEDILPAIASSGRCQSLVVEVSDALEILSQRSDS